MLHKDNSVSDREPIACIHCGAPETEHPFDPGKGISCFNFRSAPAPEVESRASSPGVESAELTTHELKVWRMYFDALSEGVKTFEYRKDDREPRFAVGDVLRLREWGGASMEYSGRECLRRVTYVARGGVVPDGYCIMAFGPVAGQPTAAPTPTDTQRLDWWFTHGMDDSVLDGSVDLWWADEQDGNAVERVTHGTSIRDTLDRAMRGIHDPENAAPAAATAEPLTTEDMRYRHAATRVASPSVPGDGFDVLREFVKGTLYRSENFPGVQAALDALLSKYAQAVLKLDGYENFTWPDGETEDAALAAVRLHTALEAAEAFAHQQALTLKKAANALSIAKLNDLMHRCGSRESQDYYANVERECLAAASQGASGPPKHNKRCDDPTCEGCNDGSD